MKKGMQKENASQFIYAHSIHYRIIELTVLQKTINIFLNYQFLANSVPVLFEVLPGGYSIAPTFWPVSWGALLSYNIHRPLDIPEASKAILRQPFTLGAARRSRAIKGMNTLLWTTAAEAKLWDCSQKLKGNTITWEKSWEELFYSCEAAKWERSRSQRSGKGSLMKHYSKDSGGCFLLHILQKEEGDRNTLRAVQLNPCRGEQWLPNKLGIQHKVRTVIS